MTAGKPAPRRLAVAAAVAAGALLLGACGSDDSMGKESGHQGHSSSHGSSEQPKSGQSPAPGAFNGSDVKFAQMMIPHHEQALEMSRLADGRASDKEVTQLAGDIEKAQDPEIKSMKSWLKSWGKPESAGQEMDHGETGHGGMDHGETDHSGNGSGMPGMMSGADMKKLKAAEGKEFDREFTRMMIDHHKGAIEMAEDERRNGRNATAKKLAGSVITSQSAEVAKLQKILDRL